MMDFTSQTAGTRMIDQLVPKLLNKSIEKIPSKIYTNNYPSEPRKEVNIIKLLINQMDHLEQELHSISSKINNTKQQLNGLLDKQDGRENTNKIEDHTRLMNYIHGSLNYGMSYDTIKQELISKGWPEETINKVFNII